MLDIIEAVVESEVVNTVYQAGRVELDIETAINSYVLLRSEQDLKHTALVRHIGKQQYLALNKNRDQKTLIKPRDSKQAVFYDCLYTPEILLNIAIGTAGTGKTTLAISYAVDQYLTNRKKILMTKPTSTVGKGKAFGPVPGDVKEKYAPYLASYRIVLKNVLGDKAETYLREMERREELEFIPIEMARGCTFDNCTFILDEAQNLSWHELNTIISRMGENTKMIILGDLRQIDTGSLEAETGLYKLIHSQKFCSSNISSAIQLTAQYRSPITQLIAEIDSELRGEIGSRRK